MAAEISDETLQRLRLPQPEHAAFVRDAIFGMMGGALVVPQIDGCDMLTGRKVDFALKVAMAKVRKFRMTKFIQKAGIAPSTATIMPLRPSTSTRVHSPTPSRGQSRWRPSGQLRDLPTRARAGGGRSSRLPPSWLLFSARQ